MNRTFLHESEYRGIDVMERIADCSIAICGAGAIGSNLADNLARTGFRYLKIIDMDRVEQHNIGNQIYDLADVGARKAEIVRNRLFRSCGAEVEIETKQLDSRNAKKFLRGFDLVIDAFDNSVARQAIQDYVRESNTACLHVGLFEGYCEAIWDEQYRVPADVAGDVCEYPLARNLVMLAVSLASELLVRYVADGSMIGYSATLGDFCVEPIEA